MDFAGATQVFNSPVSGFKAIWIAESLNPVMTTENVRVVPDFTFSDCPPLDMIFVPGGGSDGVTTQMFNNSYQNFLKKHAKKKMWMGSICTGAFIVTAAGLFNGFVGDEVKGVSTYWSQLPNLALLQEKFNFKISAFYPRYTYDTKTKRFSGGGISSSVDLALKLVEVIKGKESAEKTQLFIQYAPNPPVQSGDPTVAPTRILSEISNMESDFTAAMNVAVQKLLKQYSL
jgi:cyclohexyl-isocyanide hydratase